MKNITGRIICFILTSAFVLSSVSVTSNAARENLASELTAIGSSSGAQNVTDADYGTIWEGQLEEGADTYVGVCAPENEKIKFNTVVIREAETENGYGIDGYKIQVSDDMEVWTDIPGAVGEAIGELAGELYLQKPYNVRAVRLLVTASDISKVAISELELYDYSGNIVKEDKEADISDKYHEALVKLKAFGIYEDYSRKSFPFGSGMARADFLKVIARVAGGENNILGNDVNDEIVISYLKMIMSENLGKEAELSFLYNDTMTYQEAYAVLISLGGYARYANAMGGYPEGYMQLSVRRKIFDGIAVGMNDTVTNGNFALMLYNLLMTEPMEAVSYGAELEYGVIKDETILSKKLGIYEIEGLVEGDEYSMLHTESTLGEDEIMIDNMPLKIYNNAMGKWLGKYVNCWYRDNDDEEGTVVFIEENIKKADRITIDADDIISYNNNKYVYYKNKSRKESVNLDVSAKLLYNGKYMTDFDDAFFIPTAGVIELTDIDKDGKYDILHITAYENFIIDTVDLTQNIIYSAKDSEKTLSFNENDVRYEMVLENGAKITPEKLRLKDVLTIKQSQDKTIVSITVSRNKIDGIITQASENEDGYFQIGVKDKTYLVDKAYMDELEENGTIIGLNSCGTLYLDMFGRVAYAQLKQTGTNTLGFLTFAREVDDIECAVIFKVFDESGELKNYTLAESVMVNGTRMDANKENLINEGILNADGTTKRQLIAFSLDKELNIKRIYTACTPEQNVSGDAILEKSIPVESSAYFSGQQRFKSFLINNKTLIFSVPSDSFSGADKDKFFKIKRNSNFVNEMSGYNVEAYNVNEVMYAPVVVEYLNSAQGKILDSQKLLVVRKISTGINEDDELIKYLHVMEDGVEVKYPVLDDQQLNQKLENGDCEYGDIISVAKNESGEICAYNKVFDFSDVREEKTAGSSKSYFSVPQAALKSPTNFYSNLQTLFGTVEKKEDDIILLNVNIRGSGSTLYPHRIKKNSTFYVVDMAGKEIRKGSVNDIIEGEKDTAIFIRMKHTSVSEVVIYKNCSYATE